MRIRVTINISPLFLQLTKFARCEISQQATNQWRKSILLNETNRDANNQLTRAIVGQYFSHFEFKWFTDEKVLAVGHHTHSKPRKYKTRKIIYYVLKQQQQQQQPLNNMLGKKQVLGDGKKTYRAVFFSKNTTGWLVLLLLLLVRLQDGTRPSEYVRDISERRGETRHG